MQVKSFATEREAREFEVEKKASRYLTRTYPPTKPGKKNLEGRWVVWFW